MNTLKLKKLIEAALPDWYVVVDEAQMVNIELDKMDKWSGLVYIEEFVTWNNRYSGYGRKQMTNNDVYFIRLCDFECDAAQRIHIRQEEIEPACRVVEKAVREEFNVGDFMYDTYPRGFDANEVLIHMRFDTTEELC